MGKTLGQYEILGPLGSGGMGDVYRALDKNLKREVAIKVLPDDMAADEERLARLQREAHLLASVNHPNIAAIYNLEQSEGTRWLVLELVEGQTLEQQLRQGPIPVQESLRIARQVAGALEAAHEKGIVHRDLKAANVMLDEKGRVKVLDFGIAKDISGGAVDDSSDTQVATQAANLTATGVIVGTVPYMSPEQIRGKQIDKRTDNWAFGCLLFELLTGQRPFDRETIADTLSAVLEHEPDWSKLPPDTPEAAQALMARCLRKDPDLRLHDVADARAELSEIEATGTSARLITAQRDGMSPASSSKLNLAVTAVGLGLLVGVVGWGLWWAAQLPGDEATDATGAAAAGAAEAVLGPNSVAVLPFEVASRDPDAEFFLAGLAPEIVSRLQSIDGLQVSAWTSSSRVGDDVEPQQAGRDLGVSKVLDGNVQTTEQILRVNVILTDVGSGDTLWVDRVDLARQDLDSIFAFYEDVAVQVASVLELEIGGDAEQRLAIRPTQSVPAYNAYLRGAELWSSRDAASLYEALDHFREATELDPDFALAHAEMATMYLLLQQYAGLDRAEAFPKVLESAETALRLDPQLGRPHGVIGSVMALMGEPGWEEEFETALTLSPNDQLMHQTYGWRLALGSGDSDKVRFHWERAVELDPLMAAPRENLGILALAEGHFDEAIKHYRQAVELDEQYALAHMGLGHALHYGGRADDAIEPLREAQRLNAADSRYTENLARALADLGRTREAVAMLRQTARLNLDDAMPYIHLGDIYRDNLGELGNAATMFEAAYELASGEERDTALAKLALLDLDRGDGAAAEQRVVQLEDGSPNNGWTPYARLSLDLFRSRYDDGAALAAGLAARKMPSYYQSNGRTYFDNRPREPLGYFGVLADRSEDSRLYFETNYPDLLDDDPPVHAFTLKATVDLAAVLMNSGEEDHANLLLNRAEDYLDGLSEDQRRNQFRTVPMLVYALQDRADEAFAAMDLAFDDGWRSGWWRLEHKPHFDLIRDDPRWQPMIAKLREAASQ